VLSDQALDELARDTARALWAGESSEHVLPSLVTLAREAAEGSDTWCFAHRQLAALMAPTDPWRASLLCRKLLAEDRRDAGAWAALGLAQSLLGHLRFAVRCYERALRLSPKDPRVCHNLGHLYDVALDEPERARPLLERAHQALPQDADVAASLAHALGRLGQPREALVLLRPRLERGATRDQRTLLAWLQRAVDDG
jgi:Flp pilus assembly protein TadD